MRIHQSCTGLVVFVGSAPVSWSSKYQISIQTSNYGAEFMVQKMACKEAIPFRYMLRSLGVAIKGQINFYGDVAGQFVD